MNQNISVWSSWILDEVKFNVDYRRLQQSLERVGRGQLVDVFHFLSRNTMDLRRVSTVNVNLQLYDVSAEGSTSAMIPGIQCCTERGAQLKQLDNLEAEVAKLENVTTLKRQRCVQQSLNVLALTRLYEKCSLTAVLLKQLNLSLGHCQRFDQPETSEYYSLQDEANRLLSCFASRASAFDARDKLVCVSSNSHLKYLSKEVLATASKALSFAIQELQKQHILLSSDVVSSGHTVQQLVAAVELKEGQVLQVLENKLLACPDSLSDGLRSFIKTEWVSTFHSTVVQASKSAPFKLYPHVFYHMDFTPFNAKAPTDFRTVQHLLRDNGTACSNVIKSGIDQLVLLVSATASSLPSAIESVQQSKDCLLYRVKIFYDYSKQLKNTALRMLPLLQLAVSQSLVRDADSNLVEHCLEAAKRNDVLYKALCDSVQRVDALHYRLDNDAYQSVQACLELMEEPKLPSLSQRINEWWDLSALDDNDAFTESSTVR